MDKQKLIDVFEQIKAKANLDYAITNTDDYGDCTTCVNYTLMIKFGESSKGIFLRHYEQGMNADVKLEQKKKLYIAHDLTYEQGSQVLEVLKQYYLCEMQEYDSKESFVISETKE